MIFPRFLTGGFIAYNTAGNVKNGKIFAKVLKGSRKNERGEFQNGESRNSDLGRAGPMGTMKSRSGPESGTRTCMEMREKRIIDTGLKTVQRMTAELGEAGLIKRNIFVKAVRLGRCSICPRKRRMAGVTEELQRTKDREGRTCMDM